MVSRYRRVIGEQRFGPPTRTTSISPSSGMEGVLMGEDHDQYYTGVMRLIKAEPTPQNLKACYAWQAAGGGTAAWNPWNTTQNAPGATDYNSAGVKNYATAQAGYQATAGTLNN